jgi:hypothetical protein
MSLIRFDKHDATTDLVSLFATACILARLFDNTRASIEDRLLQGEVIETHWFTYRIETLLQVIAPSTPGAEFRAQR